MWDLPGSEMEAVSLALAGGSLTTGPPEKSSIDSFLLLEKLFGCTESLLLHAGFIYFWLAEGTRCCSAWAVHCGVFFYCGAQTRGAWASGVAVHGLSCSAACGVFPDQDGVPIPCIGR